MVIIKYVFNYLLYDHNKDDFCALSIEIVLCLFVRSESLII